MDDDLGEITVLEDYTIISVLSFGASLFLNKESWVSFYLFFAIHSVCLDWNSNNTLLSNSFSDLSVSIMLS